jgi:hypothetical protein
MKIVLTTLSTLILLIAFSCKQVEAPAEEAPVIEYPKTTFDAPFPKNNKQLSKIFGELLLIKNFNDTIFLKISSNKNDNLITDSRTGDTIFYGKVCKFRDFYYFNNKVNDTSYYISAFKIKDDLIYGLNCWSQYFSVDEQILKGNGRELIKSISADTSSIRLKPIKKDIKKLFALIMNEMTPDTILNSKSELARIAQRESSEPEIDEIENVIKVYPNPATEFINISLSKKSFYQLYDFNNKMVLLGKLNDLENRIDISNQKPGIYLLKLSTKEKSESKTVKIIIK